MTDDLFELEAQQDEPATTEAGPAHMQPPAPVSQLTRHWGIAQNEFKESGVSTTREMLALGAIRAVYWLALGSGELALSTDIAEWWEACEPLHGLGETIK